jgi:hypothetical protein
MADKASFTPEEWQLLMEGVMASGMAVSAAEPSGLIGTLKEALASGSALSVAKSTPQSNELVRAIVTDFATSEGRKFVQAGLKEKLKGAKAGDIKNRSIAMLREATAVLDAKAPQDAPAVKTLLREVSERVANASREGGFLGFGGVTVSDAEKATLKEISSVLQTA